MGKKKQKVRWCLVDGLKWSTQEQEETSSSTEGPPPGQLLAQHHQHHHQQQPADRRNSQGTWRENLAPRFERRHQGGQQQQQQLQQHQQQQRQVYYDGEYCDAEELPNGFTKIRSKNLDILFKRDYYEQKIAQREKEREQLEQQQQPPLQEVSTTTETTDTQETPAADQAETEPAMETDKQPASTSSFHTLDPNEIPEFKPMNQNPEREMASGQSSPFYPGYTTTTTSYGGDQHQVAGGYGYPPVPPRPNLYLYSPSNNTLIPCEEIIIPNPVMSAEGPVYTGPTNIYLAYPVSGPDGRGYITQPFSPPPLQQDYLTYSAYSPSISVDGSVYQSSTPQTPNSGQESGSSTQPTSPPPLADYHPANWFRKEPQTPPFLRKKMGEALRTSTEDSRQGERSADDSGSSSTTPTVQYIPGLPVDSLTHHHKKAQKKKRKKKAAEPPGSGGGHRGSTSSETELPPPLQELHLTDVLADYMVNPPTEPECSDEETLSCSQEAGGAITRDATLTSFEIPANSEESSPCCPLVPTEGGEEEEQVVVKEVEESHTVSEVVSEEPKETAVLPPAAIEEEDAVAQTDVEPQEMVQPAEVADAAVEETPMLVSPAETLEAAEPMDTTPAVEDSIVEVASVPVVAENTVTFVEDISPAVMSSGTEESNPATYEVVSSSPTDVVPAVPTNKNRNKRRNRTKNTQPTAATAPAAIEEPIAGTEQAVQPSQPPSPAKSYSAVCRSGPELPSPVPVVVVVEEQQQQPPVSQPSQSPPQDQWENVPASLAAAPERWQRKKDRKRKNKKAVTVELEEEEKMQEGEDEEQPESKEEEAISQQPTKEATPEPAKTQQPEAEEVKESQPEGETEENRRNKSMKKRRRKHTSEEPEEGHRVIICDNQIEIRLCRLERRASELTSHQLDLARSSGFCSMLVVEKLGCGMARGSINLGRLYQGKYVPPDRVDGLLPDKEEKDVEQEQENDEQELTCREVEEAVPVAESSAEDLDLD